MLKAACLHAAGRQEGTVQANGHPQERDQFVRLSGYVEQARAGCLFQQCFTSQLPVASS